MIILCFKQYNFLLHPVPIRIILCGQVLTDISLRWSLELRLVSQWWLQLCCFQIQPEILWTNDPAQFSYSEIIVYTVVEIPLLDSAKQYWQEEKQTSFIKRYITSLHPSIYFPQPLKEHTPPCFSVGFTPLTNVLCRLPHQLLEAWTWDEKAIGIAWESRDGTFGEMTTLTHFPDGIVVSLEFSLALQ